MKSPGNAPTGEREDSGEGLRVDAERNRSRVMEAARRLYATEGLGVSMAAIAREAGVGKATVSRRFATRERLVEAVFVDRMDEFAATTARALTDPDPWQGFTQYISTVCAMQAADRGFADVLTLTFPGAEVLEARRAKSYVAFLELISRAKDTGCLRADFVSEDMIVLLFANAGVLAGTRGDVTGAWRRLVAPLPALRRHARGTTAADAASAGSRRPAPGHAAGRRLPARVTGGRPPRGFPMSGA